MALLQSPPSRGSPQHTTSPVDNKAANAPWEASILRTPGQTHKLNWRHVWGLFAHTNCFRKILVQATWKAPSFIHFTEEAQACYDVSFNRTLTRSDGPRWLELATHCEIEPGSWLASKPLKPHRDPFRFAGASKTPSKVGPVTGLCSQHVQCCHLSFVIWFICMFSEQLNTSRCHDIAKVSTWWKGFCCCDL